MNDLPEKNSITEKRIAEEAFGSDKSKNKRENLFGKISYWVVDSGILEVLRANAVKLYVVLVCNAHISNGIGRISNKTKAKLSGISYKSITKYMNELKNFGLIKTWRRGWVNYYLIVSSKPKVDSEYINFLRTTKIPKNMESYSRNSQTGRFKSKKLSESIPNNTESVCPRNTDSA